MTHRGPFQPLPFCDSVNNYFSSGATVCMLEGLCYLGTSSSIYGGEEFFEHSLSE